MNIETKIYIKEMVENLKEEYHLEYPFTIKRIEKFINKIGGTIIEKNHYIDFTEEEILFKTGQNSFTIYKSKYWNDYETKFIICLQLGYLFLHLGYLNEPELWQENRIKGIKNSPLAIEQATYMAKELLIPTNLFKEDLIKLGKKEEYTKEDIKKLSKKYKVKETTIIDKIVRK